MDRGIEGGGGGEKKTDFRSSNELFLVRKFSPLPGLSPATLRLNRGVDAILIAHAGRSVGPTLSSPSLFLGNEEETFSFLLSALAIHRG